MGAHSPARPRGAGSPRGRPANGTQVPAQTGGKKRCEMKQKWSSGPKKHRFPAQGSPVQSSLRSSVSGPPLGTFSCYLVSFQTEKPSSKGVACFPACCTLCRAALDGHPGESRTLPAREGAAATLPAHTPGRPRGHMGSPARGSSAMGGPSPAEDGGARLRELQAQARGPMGPSDLTDRDHPKMKCQVARPPRAATSHHGWAFCVQAWGQSRRLRGAGLACCRQGEMSSFVSNVWRDARRGTGSPSQREPTPGILVGSAVRAATVAEH